MASRVDVSEPLAVNEHTVLSILDEEAKASARAATKVALDAVKDEAPVGKTKVLRPAHRMSVRRTRYGYQGRIRRMSDAWYGRIVERGRKKGKSKRPGSRGRRYPAAPADPFVDRAATRVASQAEDQLEAGGARAAARIEQRLGG